MSRLEALYKTDKNARETQNTANIKHDQLTVNS